GCLRRPTAVDLPLRPLQSHDQRGAPAMSSPKRQAAPPPGDTGHKLLLVEDDQALRTLLRTTLIKEGYAVVEAADRREGLALLEEHPDIAVAIIDLGLPPV